MGINSGLTYPSEQKTTVYFKPFSIKSNTRITMVNMKQPH